MAKLRMPDDRQQIHWLIFDRLLGLELAGKRFFIPKPGDGDDPRNMSHQLNLPGMVDDVSVRLGVNELIDAGKIVVSEPEWVGAQPAGSELESRVLYARAVT